MNNSISNFGSLESSQSSSVSVTQHAKAVKRQLNVIFLSGAGGVGKTSVAKALKLQCEDEGLKALIVPSTTRASYAKAGVRDEAHGASLGTAGQIILQNQIFEDYCENLKNCVKEAARNGYDVICVDRSPYDHISYILQLVPSLDLEFIEKRLDCAEKICSDLIQDYWVKNGIVEIIPSVWFFAYPTAWAKSVDINIDDGFRYAPAAKNYVWSLCLQQMLKHQAQNILYKAKKTFRLREFEAYNNSTPEQRALHILREQSLTKTVPRR